MTERMKKNYPMLQAIHQCSKKERKELLKCCRPTVINAICDCIPNVVHGNIPITNHQKGLLRKNIPILKELTQPRISAASKKKLIVQKGEGFLSAILGPALNALTGILGLSK